MYRYKLADCAKDELADVVKKSLDGVKSNIQELEENPYKKAKKIEKKLLGEYYINAGNKYSIIFNIDDNERMIEIYRVIRQARLHKLLKD